MINSPIRTPLVKRFIFSFPDPCFAIRYWVSIILGSHSKFEHQNIRFYLSVNTADCASRVKSRFDPFLGSSFSDRDVNPERLEKRTVTYFRSPSASGTAAFSTPGSSFVPHPPQNLSPKRFSKLQIGQMIDNFAPHSLQNFLPSGFSS